jgi:predicted nucleic acid-binding protein
MRYLLDTNILSKVTKPVPSDSLLAWMTDRNDTDLFISSLTVGEMRRGVLEKPAGRKRDQLEAWFSGAEGPQALFADRAFSHLTKGGSDLGASDGRWKGQRPPT